MGSQPKKPVYVLVEGDVLGSISEDNVLELGSDPPESLLQRLEYAVADEVLTALRKSFSLTFPTNPFFEGKQQCLAEIRRVSCEALIEMPGLLEELGLPPIPPRFNDPRVARPKVFLYVFAGARDLRVQVRYQGKRHSLFGLLEPAPADDLIRLLRGVVSSTFTEVHDEVQHQNLLEAIRFRIWSVLPRYNEELHSIEVEPIAERPAEPVE